MLEESYRPQSRGFICTAVTMALDSRDISGWDKWKSHRHGGTISGPVTWERLPLGKWQNKQKMSDESWGPQNTDVGLQRKEPPRSMRRCLQAEGSNPECHSRQKEGVPTGSMVNEVKYYWEVKRDKNVRCHQIHQHQCHHWPKPLQYEKQDLEENGAKSPNKCWQVLSSSLRVCQEHTCNASRKQRQEDQEFSHSQPVGSQPRLCKPFPQKKKKCTHIYVCMHVCLSVYNKRRSLMF